MKTRTLPASANARLWPKIFEGRQGRQRLIVLLDRRTISNSSKVLQ